MANGKYEEEEQKIKNWRKRKREEREKKEKKEEKEEREKKEKRERRRRRRRRRPNHRLGEKTKRTRQQHNISINRKYWYCFRFSCFFFPNTQHTTHPTIMGGLISALWGRIADLWSGKEIKILIVGLDNAGKVISLRHLCVEKEKG
jgi:hypothetical protein